MDDKKLIEKARIFAEKAHTGQKRHNGEPYFNHLLATANSLQELGMSAPTIAAGFLHDTVEDTGVAPETIEKEFGKDVRFIVEGVTKLGHIKYHGTDRHKERFGKLSFCPSRSGEQTSETQ